MAPLVSFLQNEMLLGWLEDHFTYKPCLSYQEELLPKDCSLEWIGEENSQIEVLSKIKNKDVICINCHGNATNISGLQALHEFYSNFNFSYILFDYPGYGRSQGKPSEKTLYQSLDLVIQHVTQNLGFSYDQIILHGISLGGAVAIEGLSKYQVKCGIIDAGFTSNKEMARFIFPRLPLSYLIKMKYNNLEKVKKIETPVLFIHGDQDQVIPYRMSEELHEAKAGEKDLLIMPGVEHNDNQKIKSDICIKRAQDFVAKY